MLRSCVCVCVCVGARERERERERETEGTSTHLSGVSEHVDEVEVGGEGDLPVLELLHPVPVEQPAVLLVEGSGVGQEGRGQQHVPHQPEADSVNGR